MQGAHRPAVPMGHHRHRSVSGHTQCAPGSGGGNIRPDLASYHRRTSGCLFRTWHGCRARSSGSRGLHVGQRRAQHGAGVCRGFLQTSATYSDFGRQTASIDRTGRRADHPPSRCPGSRCACIRRHPGTAQRLRDPRSLTRHQRNCLHRQRR